MLPTVLCVSLLLGYAWSLMSLHRIEAEMRAYYLLDCDLALDLASTKHADVHGFVATYYHPTLAKNGARQSAHNPLQVNDCRRPTTGRSKAMLSQIDFRGKTQAGPRDKIAQIPHPLDVAVQRRAFATRTVRKRALPYLAHRP
jgi:hypothetical protein